MLELGFWVSKGIINLFYQRIIEDVKNIIFIIIFWWKVMSRIKRIFFKEREINRRQVDIYVYMIYIDKDMFYNYFYLNNIEMCNVKYVFYY